MKMVKKVHNCSNILSRIPIYTMAGLALMSLSNVTQADSLRIKSIANGHYYQHFDANLTWAEAQATCKTKGAHLATVTSEAEDGFIQANLIINGHNSVWIGGSDSAKEGTFTWVTGESLSYSNFGTLNTAPDYDYLYFDFWPNAGKFNTSRAIDVHPYICEWSSPNYIGVTTVPDLNNNGIDETAALYVKIVAGKHTVKIRDPQTDTNLSTLTFLASLTPPQGVVVLSDISGNAVPEIGVLYNDSVKNQPIVGIKDAKNNVKFVKTILFLDNSYEPKAISVSPDSNANGADEITVIGINKTTGKAKSETRDSGTGTLLNDTLF